MSELSSEQTERIKAIRRLNILPKGDRNLHTIMALEKGGCLSFHGETWLILEKSKYHEQTWDFKKSQKSEVWELSLLSLTSGKRTTVEWELDDELEISLTGEKVRLRTLKGGNGNSISRQDLEEIAEEEYSVFFEGQEFEYDDDESWAALYHRDNQGKGERVRFYEFETESGRCLTVEEWHDDEERDCEVYTSQNLRPQEVVILQLSMN